MCLLFYIYEKWDDDEYKVFDPALPFIVNVLHQTLLKS